MIPLTLNDLVTVLGAQLDRPSELTVDAVTTDSRCVPAGRPLFIALRTDAGDGHDHAAAAVAAGAVAVLADRDLGPVDAPVLRVANSWFALRTLATVVRERLDPTTVAITGSVGKTTVKDLTAAAVGAARRTHAAVGSYNNELGVPLTVLSAPADTEVLVAEIGARHVGDIADLAPIVAPRIAVVTAVRPAHLGVFGSIDAIERTKRELVEALPTDGLAILNLADERVARMAGHAPAVLSVATDLPADVHAREVQLDEHARARARAVTPWGEVEVRLPIAGRHHVVNALFALAVAGSLDVPLEDAAASIAGAAVSRSRSNVQVHGGVTVLDDAYNANPTAVEAALATLDAIAASGRRIAVLGRMAELGEQSAEAHAAIGRCAAAAGLDALIVVGDPSDADDEVAPLAAAARDHGLGAVSRVPDAAAAAAAVAELARPGDVVLVKGSRVVGLDRVVAALTAAGEVAR